MLTLRRASPSSADPHPQRSSSPRLSRGSMPGASCALGASGWPGHDARRGGGKKVGENVWRFRYTCVLFSFMSGATPTAERREEIAGELAECLHAAAREAQRKLLAAETTEDFASHTNSLCKLARGVRQCLAMHAKFEHGRLTGA